MAGTRIIDACAGEGSKKFHLAALVIIIKIFKAYKVKKKEWISYYKKTIGR